MLGASTTAEDVIRHFNARLDGKNILITGASSGIGVECARVLAKAGGNVWLAGRNLGKTREVAEKIMREEELTESTVHVIELDLSSLSSVNQCVNEFLSLNIPLHVLLNNAGCMAIEERTVSVDGFEMQIATNHLGHFALTNGLIEPLKRGVPSRIVNLSSMAHWRSEILFDDMHFTGAVHPYEPWKAYGQSKTANILHAVELNRRYSTDGITSVSLHPGVIETELWRHAGTIFKMNKTIPQGAATSVYCVVCPTIQGGKYYNDCQEADCAPHASSESAALRFWELSQATIG